MQTPYVVQPDTVLHVPPVHAKPSVHTWRQAPMWQTSPPKHCGVDVHEPPVGRLPVAPQSVTSVARDVFSRRQPWNAQPVAPARAASYVGSHGTEQSP